MEYSQIEMTERGYRFFTLQQEQNTKGLKQYASLKYNVVAIFERRWQAGLAVCTVSPGRPCVEFECSPQIAQSCECTCLWSTGLNCRQSSAAFWLVHAETDLCHTVNLNRSLKKKSRKWCAKKPFWAWMKFPKGSSEAHLDPGRICVQRH